ncbi:unnamed protein product [Cyclocybe aegerita]|uniref:Phosphoinositide phospholipase C n=1 Tax=Cyclocybe aegerita TaxID=1973307 RepID=A0A8S0W5H8_CYCAE|nr:unnamed protein product [Cyclocybe aegerita]
MSALPPESCPTSSLTATTTSSAASPTTTAQASRSLRRAEDIRSSDLFDDSQDAKPIPEQTNGVALSRGGLRASIKRKLLDFKDRSSQDDSFGAGSSKGHSRSMSDATGLSRRPILPIHSASAPVEMGGKVEPSSETMPRRRPAVARDGPDSEPGDESSASAGPSDCTSTPQRSGDAKTGLRASLKRKFRDLKDRSRMLGRSYSLNAQGETMPTPSRGVRKAHSRSLSDVTVLAQSISPPVAVHRPDGVVVDLKGKGREDDGHAAGRLPATLPPPLPILTEGVAEPPTATLESGSPAIGNIRVPQLLQLGTPMTKVSAKKHQKFVFRLDADLGQIVWESKKHKIIPIENIKEIRSGEDARYYRQQFQLSSDYEDRWLTIIYFLSNSYKTLHLIAATRDVFRLWDRTLRQLHAVRQELMKGLGNGEMREKLWEKQYWKGADEEEDQKLSLEEVEKLCRRLNVMSSKEDLGRLFKQADTQQRGFLDFDDFRRFVKLLKARPEIDRLHKKLRAPSGGVFDYSVFEKFMREKQKSTLKPSELRDLFDKYAVLGDPTLSRSDTGSSLEPLVADGWGTSAPAPSSSSPSSAPPDDSSPSSTIVPHLTLQAFTSFLLSPDNSAFADLHHGVWHDMTRPLAEYFISSSHNTYLVGHQLVGVSTVEGYIRALLAGCRSVEVDIYDGESEPMITHGKTFTSKVSLKEVCEAIAKYGFVASPYPIIISAEVHCGLAGQDMIANIMISTFGEALVRINPGDSPDKVEILPSPEELKYKILLKAKNLHLIHSDSGDSDGGYATDPSSSASDSEAFFDLVQHYKKQPQTPLPQVDSPIAASIDSAVPPMTPTKIKTKKGSSSDASVKEQISKARTNILQRVRGVGRAGSRSSNASLPPTPTAIDTVLPGVALSQSPPLITSPALQSNLPFSPPPSAVLISSPATQNVPNANQRTTFEIDTRPRPGNLTFASTPGTSIPIPIPTPLSPARAMTSTPRPKPKMSMALVALLVYTVGVKCRGLNKKEEYAPEHVFSLSENVLNKTLRFGNGMWDLIKHTKGHLVRTYPKGTRLSSTNYEPHRFWAAGAQLVAINWQTFDLGFMINHAMFQRNGRSGYVLKPMAIRLAQKDLLAKRTMYNLEATIISAQQLPLPRDASGREVADRAIVDPYVEVTVYIPDWPILGERPAASVKKSRSISRSRGRDKSRERGERREDSTDIAQSPSVDNKGFLSPTPSTPLTLTPLGLSNSGPASTPPRAVSSRTSVVRRNGFNPVWEEKLAIPFDVVGDMMDLVFVRFVVRQEDKEGDEPLAVYCASLGSLQSGYRHLPLHDSQLSQYLFSTLFVRLNLKSVASSIS